MRGCLKSIAAFTAIRFLVIMTRAVHFMLVVASCVQVERIRRAGARQRTRKESDDREAGSQVTHV